MYAANDIAKMIDHSVLRPNLTDDDVRRECAIAVEHDVASVCCAPSQVLFVKALIEGSNVKLSTVVGFPHGYSTIACKVFETKEAVEAGVVEIDMVLNISRLLSRDFDYVRDEIRQVCDVAHARNAIVKVILENCYLTDELKEIACRLCEEAGADFVKTSTGFGTGGATFPDLRLMRKAVSAKVQVKAAGGIRDLDSALLVRELGGTRFGCTTTSKLLADCADRLSSNG